MKVIVRVREWARGGGCPLVGTDDSAAWQDADRVPGVLNGRH